MDTAVAHKIKCPIAIEMTITEDQLKAAKDGTGILGQSFDAVNIPGMQYSIDIFVNSHLQKGKTLIYLEIIYGKGSNTLVIDVNAKVVIKSANYISTRNFVCDHSVYNGEKVCTTEELFDPEKRFIVDGKMTIEMDGYLMYGKEEDIDKKLECDNSDSSLCLALWKQENKGFTVIADGKEISIHKHVLSARSPVFARMFESGMKEAKENKVEITDFSFDIVEKAIKLCYHQSLVPHSTLEEKLQLLQFFDKYDIQPLKDGFEKNLISVMNESTVCRLTNAALLSNASKLKTKCAEFLRDCMKTKPIADFDLLDKDFAINLLKSAFVHMSDFHITD